MSPKDLWLWLYLKRPQASSWRDSSKPLSANNGGFTLIEVLVAMIVAAVFVSMTMQAIVTSAALRVVATQYDEAVSWIQEDLETVVNQAAQYEITAQPYSSRCLATLTSDGFASGFLNDTVMGLGGTSTTIGPRALGGKYYTLTRTANYTSSSDPYWLLNVTYQVTEQGGSKPIATVDTEVIPHAVFKCP
ncbi:PulJ/GspJ family protein [Acaryochloris marina]|nr:prepilin-type N-terminal cleavage/methylation domain-containing protein [Acaryochloris marina]